MNKTILNREFKHPEDGWYHLEPIGEHPNTRAGIVLVIDEKSILAMSNRFNAEAAQENFPGMLIDIDHFKLNEAKETRAMGWLMETQARPDGLYGRIRWSNTGRAAVDGGDYRFFSTEYEFKDSVAVEAPGKKEKHLRPQRLAGLTLTNDPNNRGGKPITNNFPGRSGSGDQRQQGGTPPNNDRKSMKNIIHVLGLPPESSEEAAVAKIENILNRNKVIEQENKTLTEGQVDSDLERFSDRIDPAQKATIREQLLTNRAGTIKILEGIKVTKTKEDTAKQIHNRAATSTPQTKTNGSQDSDQDIARKIEAEVQTFRVANRCGYTEAHNAVRRMKPELFAVAETN